MAFLLFALGVKVVHHFTHSRRHRRMIEDAIRNGTHIPPTPPARVDPSEKPELWEAYLEGGSWQLGSIGHGSGEKGLDIGTNWKIEYSRDWESIKPIYAGYAEPLTLVPNSDSTPNLTSLSPPVSIPIPTPINGSGPRGDDEENRRTAEVSTSTTPSLLTRVRILLNLNNSTVPASSSANDGTNSFLISTNISMSFNSPPIIRVAVLVAMPSPSSRAHGSSSRPLSTSLSPKAKAQPSTSHHALQLLSPSPTTLKTADNEEQPLPHLEIGVADVVCLLGHSGNSPTWDNAHTGREEKTIHSRGNSYAES